MGLFPPLQAWSFQPHFAVITDTVVIAIPDLCSFFFVLLLQIALLATMGHLLMGSQLQEFSTVSAGLEFLLKYLVTGEIGDLTQVVKGANTDRMLLVAVTARSSLLLIYFLLACLIFNFMMAIVAFAYADARCRHGGGSSMLADLRGIATRRRRGTGRIIRKLLQVELLHPDTRRGNESMTAIVHGIFLSKRGLMSEDNVENALQMAARRGMPEELSPLAVHARMKVHGQTAMAVEVLSRLLGRVVVLRGKRWLMLKAKHRGWAMICHGVAERVNGLSESSRILLEKQKRMAQELAELSTQGSAANARETKQSVKAECMPAPQPQISNSVAPVEAVGSDTNGLCGESSFLMARMRPVHRAAGDARAVPSVHGAGHQHHEAVALLTHGNDDKAHRSAREADVSVDSIIQTVVGAVVDGMVEAISNMESMRRPMEAGRSRMLLPSIDPARDLHRANAWYSQESVHASAGSPLLTNDSYAGVPSCVQLPPLSLPGSLDPTPFGPSSALRSSSVLGIPLFGSPLAPQTPPVQAQYSDPGAVYSDPSAHQATPASSLSALTPYNFDLRADISLPSGRHGRLGPQFSLRPSPWHHQTNQQGPQQPF